MLERARDFIKIGSSVYDINDMELVVCTAVEMNSSIEHYEQGFYTYVSVEDFLKEYNGYSYIWSDGAIDTIDVESVAINLSIYRHTVDGKEIISDTYAEKPEMISSIISRYEHIPKKAGMIDTLFSLKYNKFVFSSEDRRLIIEYDVASLGKGGERYTISELGELWQKFYDLLRSLDIKRYVFIVSSEVYPYNNSELDRLPDAWLYLKKNGDQDPLVPCQDLYQWYNKDGHTFLNGRAYKCRKCRRWYILSVPEYKFLMQKNWNMPSSCKNCKSITSEVRVLETSFGVE